MITDHKELQVYDSDQVFEEENSRTYLLNGTFFEKSYTQNRLEKEFELLRTTHEKPESQELSKNSFYSSNSDNSYTSSLLDDKEDQGQDDLMVKEFLLRMAQEVIINEKRVIVLLDSQFMDSKVQQLLFMFLFQGEQLFDLKDKKYLSMKIFDEIKEKIRKNNPKKDLSIFEFAKEVRNKLSKNICLLVCSGESQRGLLLKKVQLSHKKNKKSNQHLQSQKTFFSDLFFNSHSHPHKIDTLNIQEIMGLMKTKIDFFWDVAMDDKLLMLYMQQKLNESEHYKEDLLEFEKFSKQFRQILGYFHDLTQSDLISILNQMIHIFNTKSIEIQEHINNLNKIREIREIITNLKQQTTQQIKTEATESSENSSKNTLKTKNSFSNSTFDIDENPKIVLSLIEQSIFLLDECFPDITERMHQLEIRNIQTNLICESFIFSLVGNLPYIFRLHPKLLSLIIKDLNSKNLLVETSFHKIVKYPITEIDSDIRNLINFAMLKFINKSISSVIMLTGEDPLQTMLLNFSEFSQRIVESDESDSSLEEKLGNVLRYGQTLLLNLETCSIPQILKPFIYKEFIDQGENLSVPVGNKLINCSEKARVFLALPHKDILTNEYFKKKISDDLPIVDFFPVTEEEVYADLFMSCFFLKNPEMKEIRKKNLKKLTAISKKIYLKKRELILFLKDSDKKGLKTETKNILFYKNLNEIIKNLREHERQRSVIIKHINQIPSNIDFFKIASFTYYKLSHLNSFNNRSLVSYSRFKKFIKSIYIIKNKRVFTKQNSRFVPEKEITEKECMIIMYYLTIVKAVTGHPQQYKLILEIMNFLENYFLDNNQLMKQLLSKSCTEQEPEAKLKWMLNELSVLHGDLNTFSEYISINSNLYDRLTSDDADIFIDRLFSNFINSFAKSSESGDKSSHSSISYISQQQEMYRNFDSVKLFLLKNFRVDKYQIEVSLYIKKILNLFNFPTNYLICGDYPQLNHMPKMIKMSLELFQSPVILLYGNKSHMTAVDICLLFSRASNTKLEVCKVFAPESITEKCLIEVKNLKKQKRFESYLSKTIQKFVENIIHQAILESRPLLLDLRDGDMQKNISFLTWFKSSCFRPTSPIFICSETPCVMPLPLRMNYLQFKMTSPEYLKTILLSIFSFHMFAKDSYYNLFEKSKNNLLKLVSFYSVFIYAIMFLKKFYNNLIKLDKRTPFDFQEICLLLHDIKKICNHNFFQELILERLRNCKLIRESDENFFQRTCEYVFNVSYKSFVSRILLKEDELGKFIYIFFNFKKSSQILQILIMIIKVFMLKVIIVITTSQNFGQE
jgi:hypothetical protein